MTSRRVAKSSVQSGHDGGSRARPASGAYQLGLRLAREGAITSAVEALANTAVGVSLIAGGVLLAPLGPRGVYLLAGGLGVLAVITAWRIPREPAQPRLNEAPDDREAKSGLAQVGLARRLTAVDQADLQRRVQAGDTSRETRYEVADLLVASGDVENGLAGLIDLVKMSSGDEREEARQRLLELFDMLGEHPAVGPARRALANALF